jgi:triosephosphate isomerase
VQSTKQQKESEREKAKIKERKLKYKLSFLRVVCCKVVKLKRSREKSEIENVSMKMMFGARQANAERKGSYLFQYSTQQFSNKSPN